LTNFRYECCGAGLAVRHKIQLFVFVTAG
jgi:hypothetical protein